MACADIAAGIQSDWNFADIDAAESRGGDADDRHRVLVHQHLAAHHIRRAGELRLPEVVGEHDHGIRAGRRVIFARNTLPSAAPTPSTEK